MSAATIVRLTNLPDVTALPEMPAAKDVWIENLPGVTTLPKMSATKDVWIDGNRIPIAAEKLQKERRPL
jgi:hypothetical protein